MTFENYQRLAERTEAPIEDVVKRLTEKGELELALRLFHGATGLSTKAGELDDSIKKWVFYGQPLDRHNIREELGDMMWYVALLCNALGFNLQSLCEANIEKLRKRFPEKYDGELVKEENRNREEEASAIGSVGRDTCIDCGQPFTLENPGIGNHSYRKSHQNGCGEKRRATT